MLVPELVLFGAVYRCTVRMDDSSPLKQGAVGAFALCRAFASISTAAELFPKLLTSLGEGFIAFSLAAAAIEYALDSGAVRPLEGHSPALGMKRRIEESPYGGAPRGNFGSGNYGYGVNGGGYDNGGGLDRRGGGGFLAGLFGNGQRQQDRIGAPPGGYSGFDDQQQGYGGPPAGYGAQPGGFEGPPGGYGGPQGGGDGGQRGGFGGQPPSRDSGGFGGDGQQGGGYGGGNERSPTDRYQQGLQQQGLQQSGGDRGSDGFGDQPGGGYGGSQASYGRAGGLQQGGQQGGQYGGQSGQDRSGYGRQQPSQGSDNTPSSDSSQRRSGGGSTYEEYLKSRGK